MSAFVQQINFKISKKGVQKVLEAANGRDVYISVGVGKDQSFRVEVSSQEPGIIDDTTKSERVLGCPTPPGCKTK
ncbi:MAG: hypothetical protein WCO43_00205 [Chitinophagia bacterium]|jgi:hypothetical protein